MVGLNFKLSLYMGIHEALVRIIALTFLQNVGKSSYGQLFVLLQNMVVGDVCSNEVLNTFNGTSTNKKFL